MARELRFRIVKNEFSAEAVKVDRRKLYGWSEIVATDDNAEPCRLLTADESGSFIIDTGGTGMAILSDSGQWVERSELRTVDDTGEPAPLLLSSYSVINELKDKVTPEQFLDHNITDFYALDGFPKEMLESVGENIYTFQYTYNDAYQTHPAFILAAAGGLFMLIGEPNAYQWLCFGDCESIDEDTGETIEEGIEELDFSFM